MPDISPNLAAIEAQGEVIARGLRYVNAWKGKTAVVKFGGSVLEMNQGGTLAQDLVLLKGAGVHPVLVHGGGPEITRVLERMGKASTFVKGLRVTDPETMEVVEMVLGGRANKALVGSILQAGGQAVGISGVDGRTLVARKYRGDVDLGQVGEVEAVHPELLRRLSADGYIPVVASLGIGEDGTGYNLNADTAAGALAVALGASKFILLTDVAGVYRDYHGDRALISELRADEARAMIRDGSISRGMIPKVEACLSALAGGVPSAHIIDGTVARGLLVELFTERGVGTMLVP
ncbi:MAG TPA: acetylglutamate kinase [bacterium]|nr:acetylglutamate kinase [bacterium]